MPTAVRIESIEKTMSSSMIWTIAAPKPSTACEVVSKTSSSAPGSTLWWISLVAFHSRKRPPAMRIRSRQEKAVSKLGVPWASTGPAMPRSKTGA